MIEKLQDTDWPDLKRIYEEGITTGQATFETRAPEWAEWNSSHLPFCRLKFVSNGTMAGWAALTAVSGRCVYAGVAETSIYIAKAFRGQGIGKKLLSALIQESEKNNLWTLQAGIFPDNKGSIKIHLDSGFRIVGTREKIGKLNGIWKDTLLLERRSAAIGQD